MQGKSAYRRIKEIVIIDTSISQNVGVMTISLLTKIEAIAPFSKIVGSFSILVAMDLKCDRANHKCSLQQNDIGRNVDYEGRDCFCGDRH
jgi:hypothetical protein